MISQRPAPLVCVLSLLAVVGALSACQLERVPVWDEVDDSLRARHSSLHRELQLVLRRPEQPSRRKDLARIREGLEEILRERPRYFRARRDLQDVLAEVDRGLATRLYAEDVENPSAEQLTLAARWIDDLDRGRRLLARARELDDDFVWAYQAEAVAAAQEQDWSAALSWIEQALDRSSDFPEARALRARVLDRAGRSQEAIEAYQQSLRLTPDDHEARFRRAHLLLRTDDRDSVARARTELERLLRDPSAAEGLGALLGPATLDLGVALARQGRGAEAVAQLQRALQHGADPLDVHYNLGWVRQELLDQPRAALAEYERYLELATAGDVAMSTSQVLDFLFHVRARVRDLQERIGAEGS